MWEEIGKAFSVYLLSMLKFIAGPVSGKAFGLNIVTTILVTIAGMMTVVLGFTYFGDFLKNRIFNKFFRNHRRNSMQNRKFVQLWKKYGLTGVAILTPLILTPIGGTLLAISFGAQRNKLILAMFVSASIWALVFSTIVYFFGNLLPDFLK